MELRMRILKSPPADRLDFSHPIRKSSVLASERDSFDYETLNFISTLKSTGVGSPSRTVGWYFLFETAFNAAAINNG